MASQVVRRDHHFKNDAEPYAQRYKIVSALERSHKSMSEEQKEAFRERHGHDLEFVQLNFLDPDTNQLTWEEHLDDSKVPDTSEWLDKDFTFTANHPDWGADSIVKNYFQEAQDRVQAPAFRMPDSTITWEERYESIVNSERKKQEKDDRYDSHPSDAKPEKASAKATKANPAPSAKSAAKKPEKKV